MHRKKHNLSPSAEGEGGGGDGEAEVNGEEMEAGGNASGSGGGGVGLLKHEKPAVTRARALVESAKKKKVCIINAFAYWSCLFMLQSFTWGNKYRAS